MYRINDLNHIINRTCMFKTQERISEKRGSILHRSGSQEVSVHIKRDQKKGKAFVGQALHEKKTLLPVNAEYIVILHK